MKGKEYNNTRILSRQGRKGLREKYKPTWMKGGWEEKR